MKISTVPLFHYEMLNHGLYGYMLYLTSTQHAANHALYYTLPLS